MLKPKIFYSNEHKQLFRKRNGTELNLSSYIDTFTYFETYQNPFTVTKSNTQNVDVFLYQQNAKSGLYKKESQFEIPL